MLENLSVVSSYSAEDNISNNSYIVCTLKDYYSVVFGYFVFLLMNYLLFYNSVHYTYRKYQKSKLH